MINNDACYLVFMILVPVVYYLFFTIYLHNKRGNDISFFMSFVYFVSSLCAVFLYMNSDSSFEDFHARKLGIIPAFLFCLIPSLFILPFNKYNSNKVRNVEILTDTKLFDRICYLYIILFFVNIFVYGSLVVNALTSNLGELRNEIYLGDGLDLTQGMSLPIKILFYIPLTLGGGSLFMLIFFFYSVSFLNKSKLFNILLFISSLAPIYTGIATATRTTVFYWFLMFAFCFMLFQKYIKKKTKRGIYLALLVFGSLMIVYFVVVSISRFSEMTGGTQGGILGYAGQPYLEYSNLWETVPSEFRSVKNIFPWGNLILWHNTSGAAQASAIMGYPINGFNTIMGIFLLDFGKPLSLIVLFIYYLVINNNIRKNTRKNFSISSSIMIFILAVIPLTGLFNYYYHETDTVFAFFFFLYLAYKFKKTPQMVLQHKN